ncbi:hypothetical protein BDN72DRAFT_965355 [Pluteus cervinus]|uniref:Uncharacterized protein n=1 Tax=Pluteus cervinus TaxID=181527 RepID=A0ACD3A603_9AGAR|nr:hypothetical protein BDN72DRAFT_965355 [Pluteus cervinus]
MTCREYEDSVRPTKTLNQFLSPNHGVGPSRPTSPAGSIIGLELVPSSPLPSFDEISLESLVPRIVVLVDDCLSMRGERWTKIRRALGELTKEASQRTGRGIDLHFLHWKPQQSHQNIPAEQFISIIFDSVNPNGPTSSVFGWKLCSLLAGGRTHPPTKYIFFLSGKPQELDSIGTHITNAARALEDPKSQLEFEFIQFRDEISGSMTPYYAEELVQMLKQNPVIADLVNAKIWSTKDEYSSGKLDAWTSGL